jgi:hypothetical protein
MEGREQSGKKGSIWRAAILLSANVFVKKFRNKSIPSDTKDCVRFKTLSDN